METDETGVCISECARLCMGSSETQTDVPLALAAEPFGNVSLQQALQEIFELRSERVWQLHILRKREEEEQREAGWKGGVRTLVDKAQRKLHLLTL